MPRSCAWQGPRHLVWPEERGRTMGRISICATSESIPAATARAGGRSWERVSDRRPLRCVLLSQLPEQVPGFRKWIEDHRDRYTLMEVRRYPAMRGSIVEPAIFYVVCEFVPREAAVAAGMSSRLRSGRVELSVGASGASAIALSTYEIGVRASLRKGRSRRPSRGRRGTQGSSSSRRSRGDFGQLDGAAFFDCFADQESDASGCAGFGQ